MSTNAKLLWLFVLLAIGLVLVLLPTARGAQLRSPKDSGSPDRLNAPMAKTALPPAPPGYIAPSTVATAPAPALAVTVVPVPTAPFDILPPIIGLTNICFPVLAQFTNAVILASTDLIHWTPLTNFCGMAEKMFFKLQH